VELPDRAIGPTDIQAYRECPRRMRFGMRRHTDAGEHPEAQGPATAYGSAVHEAIAHAEREDATDEQAIQRAFDSFSKWLEPDDLQRLRTDLQTYRQRDYLGVRTVAVEEELRTPLFEHNGQTIYLRTRIDRLYQRLDNPHVFVHVDYKSSRWPVSEREVHKDPQLWITNLIVHEVYPECETLVQAYDQLNYGVTTTRKNDEQRALIRDYAIHQVTTILDDTEHKPAKNRWCPWCPILESCPIVPEFSHYALAEIAALAPAEKRGRKTVLNLDPELFEVYVEQLTDVELALKVLRRFDDTVRGAIREMPSTERQWHGFELKTRSKTTWPPEALRAAHEVLGDDFYEVIGLTKTAVERLGDGRSQTVLDMAVVEDGATYVQQRGGASG
jgi:PD-(D/E)XK nuclease superfamily protein